MVERVLGMSMHGNKRKSERSPWRLAPWFIIGALAAVALVIGVSPDESEGLPAARSTATSGPGAERHVTYRVTTGERSAAISLTYENAGGNTEQLDTKTGHGQWQRSFTMARGSFAYVSAQRKEGSGTIKCEILIDGRVVESATSSGQYVIATCSGRVE